jgi:hypothetical protein
MASKIAQIEEPINTTQEVIGGNVVVEIERIKQCTLIAATLTHHLGALPSQVLRSKTLKTQRRSIVFQQNMTQTRRWGTASIGQQIWYWAS